jgi:hypothetical protein
LTQWLDLDYGENWPLIAGGKMKLKRWQLGAVREGLQIGWEFQKMVTNTNPLTQHRQDRNEWKNGIF